MTKTAVIYARVSNRAQNDRGLSIPGQLRELRAWAERQGYRVAAEVSDTGGRDSKRDVFDRPGINEVFDICERQRVELVVAQSRDRFGEYPVPEMIAYRLADHGARLATPSDSQGEAGELMDLFTDWNSRRERRTTARRSRSRKLEQARKGRIVAGHTPTFGFRYAGDRAERAYEVEEDHMRVVRRVFEMVGAEGTSNRGVASRLNREGVPTPPAPVKKKHPERVYGWRPQFVRRVVLSDAYRPHTRKELAGLVSQGFMAPDVAARAPEGCGIWWYSGKDYEGEEHRVAVPVPHSGVGRETADAARANVENNVPLSSAGDGRYWELLGGILRCGGCGLRMQAHVVTRGEHVYEYLRCPQNQRTTPERCPVNARLSAKQAEEAVWGFVVGLLVEPERMVSGLDGLIEAERALLRGDPEQEIRGLRCELRDLDLRRERAQDAYLAGAFSVDELRGRQHQLDEAKEAALREIDLCENRGARLRKLADLRDRLRRRADIWNRLMDENPDLPQNVIGDMPWSNDPFARAQREALDNATPEQRRERYVSLELRVDAHSKEELEVSGLFGTETIYTWDPSRRPQGTTTPSSASTRTASSSRAAGSPRTWRASACETSP